MCDINTNNSKGTNDKTDTYKMVKVQMVGNYHIDQIESKFSDRIRVESKLKGLSPFSIVGNTDQKLIDEWEAKILDLNSWNEKPAMQLYQNQRQKLFDLKKNFDKFLSRSAEDFCDNTTFRLIGEEELFYNDSDYLIIENSAAIYDIIEYNDCFYTENWPNSPFLDFLRTHKVNKFCPLSKESFNWKHYMDLLCDTLLRYYDPSKIILITTHASKFYFIRNGNSAYRFPEFKSERAHALQKIDEYFAARTGCRVVNTLECFIPNTTQRNGWPYASDLGVAYEQAAKAIEKIILEDSDDVSTLDTASNNIPTNYSFALADILNRRLRAEKKSELSETIRLLENERCSTLESVNVEKFPQIDSLRNLEYFLGKDERELCDYILENMQPEASQGQSNCDFEVIKNYIEHFVCSTNDIIALYLLCRDCDDRSQFKDIAKLVCMQSECIAVKNANKLYRENIEFLSSYPYTNCNLPDKADNCEKKHLRISDDGWIIIDCNAEQPFDLISRPIAKSFNCASAIENGCICNIEDADALTYSFEYYINKAKKGNGKKPTFLNFKNESVFFESLWYIDYKSLLANERFVFVFNDNEPAVPSDFVPKVDLTDLVDPHTVNVRISAGLADQLGYYMFGQLIERFSSRKVIYDNSFCIDFNGLEADRFAKKPITLLSDILSERLFSSVNSDYASVKKLYSRICSSFVYICRSNRFGRYSSNAVGLCFLCNHLKPAVMEKLSYSYYDFWSSIEQQKAFFDFKLSDYVEFPPFNREEHIELSNKMNSCDSVVIHIRRGDYIALGWNTDNEYYVEVIEKIMAMPQYQNKKFFVFSDNIKWCETHKSDIGLDKVGDCEIIFVEGNKGTESFRDIQLMSFGKIFIIGESHFPRIAAIYGDRYEMFFCANQNIFNDFQRNIRKNKYSVEPISKNYAVNRLVQNKPKTLESAPPEKTSGSDNAHSSGV